MNHCFQTIFFQGLSWKRLKSWQWLTAHWFNNLKFSFTTFQNAISYLLYCIGPEKHAVLHHLELNRETSITRTRYVNESLFDYLTLFNDSIEMIYLWIRLIRLQWLTTNRLNESVVATSSFTSVEKTYRLLLFRTGKMRTAPIHEQNIFLSRLLSWIGSNATLNY